MDDDEYFRMTELMADPSLTCFLQDKIEDEQCKEFLVQESCGNVTDVGNSFVPKMYNDEELMFNQSASQCLSPVFQGQRECDQHRRFLVQESCGNVTAMGNIVVAKMYNTEDFMINQSAVQWLSPVFEDAIHEQGLTVGAEKDDSTIHVINKACMKGTSKKAKPENGITFKILSEQFGKPLEDAARSLNVSRSTLKRICRDHGIPRWQYGKRRIMDTHNFSKLRRVNAEEPIIEHFSCPGINKINVKATYNGFAIRFELLDSSGMAELEDNVIERLKMERETFSIKYQDDEGDWVLIACDKDVQKCIEISRSLKKTTIKMLVDPPIYQSV